MGAADSISILMEIGLRARNFFDFHDYLFSQAVL